MAKTFLITRPNHDLATSYLHDFSKEIIKTVKGTKDIHVTNLEGPRATRVEFENCMNKAKPGLLIVNGHGSQRTVEGHNDETILDEKNVQKTADKIVCSLSCDSLQILGPLAVEKGAKAYIGYKARYMLVKDPAWSGSPSKDKNALPFKKAYCAMVHSLVFGMPVGKCVAMAKEEYRRAVQSYGTSDDDPYGDTPLIRFALAWNLEFLDMAGNPGASFSTSTI